MKIKILQLIIIMTVFLAFNGCATAQQSTKEVHKQEAWKYYRLGQQARDRGDLDEAIQHYNNAIAMYWIFPKEQLSQIYVERAVCLIGDAQYQRGMADLDWAVEWNPGNAKAYYERGSLKIMLHQDPAAGLDDIKKAYKLDSDNEDYKKAVEYLTTEKKKE